MIDRGLFDHEARILIEEVSQRRFSALFLEFDRELSLREEEQLEVLVGQRLGGVPLQHLVGHWPFRQLELIVDARALIPRPETEEVVAATLDQLMYLFDRQRQQGSDHLLQVVDLGTGSGAIACALVNEFLHCEVKAIDRSAKALSLARENVAQLSSSEQHRITLIEGSWFAPFQIEGATSVDVIVANPPYISQSEWEVLDATVREHDPHTALVAGETGFEDLETIITGAPGVFGEAGVLVCEIGATQGEACRSLATLAGASSVEVLPDLVGRDRILVAKFFL
jgi:release factor glutamine methyltransferase